MRLLISGVNEVINIRGWWGYEYPGLIGVLISGVYGLLISGVGGVLISGDDESVSTNPSTMMSLISVTNPSTMTILSYPGMYTLVTPEFI